LSIKFNIYPPNLPFLDNQGRREGKKRGNMNIENTQSQMRKGILEFCILSIIRRGEAYPSDIVEEMKAANLHILEGTLYPLLTRLKNAEMLTYRWVESNSGPPRKYFLLTEKGEAFYKELEQTWQELSNGVNALANKKDSNSENFNQSFIQ
jgi:PadR family transcriptional regulator, regulatory protein PadR